MRLIRADNLIVADDDRGKRANGVRRDSSTLDSTAASTAKQSPPSRVVESAFGITPLREGRHSGSRDDMSEERPKLCGSCNAFMLIDRIWHESNCPIGLAIVVERMKQRRDWKDANK